MAYISKFSATENYSGILDVPFVQSFTFRNLGIFTFFFSFFFLLTFCYLLVIEFFVSVYLELFVHYPYSYFTKP